VTFGLWDKHTKRLICSPWRYKLLPCSASPKHRSLHSFGLPVSVLAKVYALSHSCFFTLGYVIRVVSVCCNAGYCVS
jgi:hypothetical protein